MDGDGDGFPCEKLCGYGFSKNLCANDEETLSRIWRLQELASIIAAPSALITGKLLDYKKPTFTNFIGQVKPDIPLSIGIVPIRGQVIQTAFIFRVPCLLLGYKCLYPAITWLYKVDFGKNK